MRILFAVDGSKYSRSAIEQALNLKCLPGTELKVVTVVDFFEPFPALEGVKEKEVAAARKLVADIVAELKEAHPEAIVTGEVLDGYAVDEILHCAKEWPAHLIVLGSHGRTGLVSLWLGSVSRSVLLHAECAVRIVRTPAAPDAQAEAPRVLLALDNSEHSEHLVTHILALPWPAGTKFRCLHVVNELVVDVLLDPDAEFASTLTRHYEEKIATERIWVSKIADEINTALGKNMASVEVLLGDPREVIIDMAEQWPADLVLIGSHDRRGFEKLVLGSVSEAVATHAKCAVEVTRMPVKRKPKVHVII